jgi:peptide/nickel transport system permease protein
MRWLGRSVLSVVPVVVGVVLCVFLLLRIVPGDPAAMILGDQATEASIQALRQRLGLDLPLGQQLADWLVAVLTRGDIGTSLVTSQPVLGLVASRAGVTAALVALSVGFTVLIAVPLAMLAATHAGGPVDHIVRVVPTLGMAMPAFWVGLLLVLVFGVQLHWLPVGGIGTGPGEPFRSLVLPALTVALGMSPPLVRSLREQLLEVLDADFVVTLRAARLPEWRIQFGHVLRNAAVPTVSLLGLNVAYLIGGTLVIEKVFAINGLGALLFSSISSRDFPVVQGIALVLALVVVVISLVTDALVALLDPRIRTA